MKRAATPSRKLSVALQELQFEASPFIFDVRQASVPVLRAALEQHGVLVVKNAFTVEAFNHARSILDQGYEQDVRPQLSEKFRDSKPWPAGIIGNKSFGFLFAQPEADKDVHRGMLNEDLEVAFSPCSGYRANLELLAHPTSQLALATLLSVTGNVNGIVSQDSVKMHRETLTKPHVDIYDANKKRLNRTQAMAIGPNEGRVRLCFGRYTHLPAIQSLISDFLENDRFYNRTGFLGVPEKKREDLLKCLLESGVIYAGEPGDMVLWKSGVIHMELLDGRKYRQTFTKTTTERFVIGTHQPLDLTQEELSQIGHFGYQGFIMHPYNNYNKDNAAGTNSVHLKKTQWKRKRAVPIAEKDRFLAIQYENVDEWIEKTPPAILHCLGVSQPLETVFTDNEALQRIKQTQI